MSIISLKLLLNRMMAQFAARQKWRRELRDSGVRVTRAAARPNPCKESL
jgi:tRNA (Thr-GGU) A37 N-methylase